MKELAQSLEQENEQKQKPPTEVSPPPPRPAAPPTAAATGADRADAGRRGRTAAAGSATPRAPGRSRSVPASSDFPSSGPSICPVLFGFAAGRLLRASCTAPPSCAPGVLGTYASLPYTDRQRTSAQQTSSSFWGALLTADYAYRVIEPLSARRGHRPAASSGGPASRRATPSPSASAGVSGAIPMPSLALSLHADYLITPHLFASLTPELAPQQDDQRRPHRSGRARSSRFDLDFGVGYRF